MKKNKNKERCMYLFIIVSSCILFVAFYGFRVLNPKYTEPWLVLSDKSQHYCGWQAFREGAWSFPIGLFNQVTYPDYTSIIFTDSIPLLEIFFKLFSFCLPEKFQYFGMWTLLCCILQSVIAAHIMRRFTEDRVYVAIASLVFVIAPIFIIRHFLHEALSAHWLVLLALDTFFLVNDGKEKKILLRMIALGFLASHVHIYFLLICGIVVAATCLYDVLDNKRLKYAIVYLVSYIGVAGLSVWSLGGFSSNIKTENAEGFGAFNANLNVLINPLGRSTVFGDYSIENYTWGQGDACAYLGIGVYFLLMVSIGLFIVHCVQKKRVVDNKAQCTSLLILGLVSFVVAIGNMITWGNKLIFVIPYPKLIIKIWSSFRCTGRTIWILVYLLMLFSLIYIRKHIKQSVALMLILVTIVFQVVDCRDMILNKRMENENAIPWVSLGDTNEEVLNKIESAQIENVIISDSLYRDGLWNDMMSSYMWAVEHHKRINYFYLARQDEEAFYKRTEKHFRQLSDDTIYIYQEKELNEVRSTGMHYVQIDNFIFAWKE